MRASGPDGVDVTEQQAIFDAATDDGPCITIGVRCHADSAVPVAINIPQMHRNHVVRIPIGEKEYFRVGSKNPMVGAGSRGISRVNAQGIGGTATIDWWVATDLI